MNKSGQNPTRLRPLKLGEMLELHDIMRSLQEAQRILKDEGYEKATAHIGVSIFQTDIFLFGDRIDELEKYLAARLNRGGK